MGPTIVSQICHSQICSGCECNRLIAPRDVRERSFQYCGIIGVFGALYVVKKYRQRLSVEKLSCIGISLLYFNVYLRQHFVSAF